MRVWGQVSPAQTLSNRGIALALGRPQHYFSAADEGVRQATRSRETLQLCAFVHAQLEGRFGAAGEHSAAYRYIRTIASYLWDSTLERNGQIGGGCSTAEITQPGFLLALPN